MQLVEANLVAPAEAAFALVAARFNELVVRQLVDGARGTLVQHGVADDRITLVRAPGCWELPWVCRRLAETGRYSALIALGAVIRGATTHYELLASEMASGLGRVALQTGVPIALGVVTTESLEHALDRAGGKAGNRGSDAALSALELVSLARELAK